MDDDELKELTDLMMVFPRKMIFVNRAVVSKYFKDSRIRPYHLMLIKGIGVNEGISQKELGAIVPFDKSYISVGVRELREMGFVYNDSEGKVHRLMLTESGRDLVSMADMMFDITGNAVMGVFTHDEIDELTKLMRKLDAHIDGVLAKYAEDNS